MEKQLLLLLHELTERERVFLVACVLFDSGRGSRGA